MKRPTFTSLLFPVGAIKRIGSSIAGTKAALSDSAKAMKAALPGQSKPGSYEEGDVRNISDAKDRFEAMYQMHNWSEPELAQQIKTTRITKIVALLMSIFSVAVTIVLAIKAPMWLSFILMPASVMVLILGVAQSCKYALYETQMELREFISMKEFVSRDDFLRRYFG